MSVTEFLHELGRQGIELWLEGRRLRFRAPQGAITPETRERLAQQKEAIVEHLCRAAESADLFIPLSHNQRALWFLYTAAPNSPAYNVGVALSVRSHVDVEALHTACQALVDRHPTLRTVYRAEQDDPVQIVRGRAEVAFSVRDTSSLSETELGERVQALHAQPFDLAKGPVFRVYLLTPASTRHVLLIGVHHIAADGWSVSLLIDELHALYRAYVTGSPAGLPRVEATYADFVRRQEALLAGPDGERMWTYWSSRLRDAPDDLLVPCDNESAADESEGASFPFQVPPELSGELRELAGRQGATLFTGTDGGLAGASCAVLGKDGHPGRHASLRAPTFRVSSCRGRLHEYGRGPGRPGRQCELR